MDVVDVKYVAKQTRDRWESDDFYPWGWTVEKAKYLARERGEGGGGLL